MSYHKLVIIGAGNFGREVFSWALDQGHWVIRDIAFLDNRPNIFKETEYEELPILGTTEEYEPSSRDLFVCAIGDVKIKRKLIEIIESKNGRFTNVIHKTLIKPERARIGNGIITAPYAVISCDTQIGDHTAINIHSSIGHDVTIGKYCQIAAHVNLAGHVTVGDGVTINSNACVIPGVKIGNGATIGAGSVVIKDVGEGETVFGNPARVISKSK